MDKYCDVHPRLGAPISDRVIIRVVDVAQAKEILAKYYNFGEAILLGIRSANLTRDYEMLVTAARDSRGELFRWPFPVVLLRFLACQEVSISNSFWPDLLGEEANWGMNEFALIRVKAAENDQLVFDVSWEHERYISITCSSIELIEDVAEIKRTSSEWLDKCLSTVYY